MISCGFIGLGNIGKPMAENIVKKRQEHNLSVAVFDVMPSPVNELLALGARSISNPEQMARECDLIGICVRNDEDVERLLYGVDGNSGMLAAGRAGTIYAIHSTVTRENIVRWAEDGCKNNINIVDAPITGGASGAAAGELCIMLGASADIAERLQPMLDCVSSKVVLAGEPGAGTVLKLANNLMNYTAFAAISEGSALVRAAGVDVEKLFEVGEANGVVSPMAKQFITGRDGMFAGCSEEEMLSIFGPFASLAEKDLDHALNLSRKLGLDLGVASIVREGIRNTFLRTIVSQM